MLALKRCMAKKIKQKRKIRQTITHTLLIL